TVHPQLFEFMTYATSKGVETALSVNPLMLTPKVGRELLDAKPKILYLSLDGHDDRSFEHIRGLPGVYEISKQRLIDFLNLKREMCSETRFVLSMINFVLNAESIRLAADEWRSYPEIDEVLMKPFTMWDGSVRDVSKFRDWKFEKRDKVVCTFPF